MRLSVKKPSSKATAPRRRSGSATVASRPSSAELSERYAFRRNRTITGSSSAHVASSNELGAELKSPRAHVHHLTNLRRKLLIYTGGVLAVSLLIYLTLAQLIAEPVVQISGVGALSSSDETAYQSALNAYFAARPVERLRFMLNTQQLLSHIQSSRPEVRSLTINRGASLGQAIIALSARTPIAHWSINGTDQFVDENGIVFSKNYFSNPTLQIVDESGLQTSDTKLVASNRFLGFVGRVIASAKQRGLNINKITIPPLTTRQVAITIAGESTYYKLSVNRSAGQQVEDITRIAKYMSANNLSPEYADVRLSGKAFYK